MAGYHKRLPLQWTDIVEAIQQPLLFGVGRGHRGEANTLATRLEAQWMVAIN